MLIADANPDKDVDAPLKSIPARFDTAFPISSRPSHTIDKFPVEIPSQASIPSAKPSSPDCKLVEILTPFHFSTAAANEPSGSITFARLYVST